ncbi:aminoglycoside phosphotransferase [Streptomyces sp. MMG1533]|uniref:aminoglycoside phosphotransferase n=1 Tax=Streptomyces sp. MMG1533 TaxID=1415546 RepID=UPI0006BFDB63|nr:aminoglycoside phosphotransferase [Streptomyces sp. MMG1533]KOU61971.1 aminoglycoside phosphotransferase [Streptomyces sp. MMG1533]
MPDTDAVDAEGPEVADAEAVSEEARQVLGPFTGPIFLSSLTHNPKNGVTGGVWTVSAGDRSAILKVLTRNKAATGRWAASDDPRHWNYWRREADVHTCGLAQLWQPYGVRAPRLLACVERSGGDIALWLERVRGQPATRWKVARHIEHARRLGAAQGAVGATDDRPWLSHRFLRQYVGSNTLGQELLDDDEAWQQPLVRDHFPESLRHEMVRLHHDRDWFLDVMESLPRAFSHLDLWPANTCADGPGSAVFDWAFAGDGALGEDLGNYLPDSVFDLFVPAARLPKYATRAYEAYLHGLRSTGWRGDENLVRLAVCASAVKYDWLTALMLANAGEEQRDYGGARAVDAERRYRERGLTLAFLGEWAREARALAPRLGFPEAPSGS